MSAEAVIAATSESDVGARVLGIPPPLYYGVAFAAGQALRGWTTPLAIGGDPVRGLVGGAVLALGASLTIAGVTQVVRHHTTIVPHHPVSTLLTTGVYRWSRNPMYAGLAVAYVGGSLLSGSWWPLLTLPLSLLAVRRVVIEPEERYLAERFGAAYLRYRTTTRRWL